MPTSSSPNHASAETGQSCDAAGWLTLAASPSFALMAWIAAIDTPRIALCSAVPGILSIGAMTAM